MESTMSTYAILILLGGIIMLLAVYKTQQLTNLHLNEKYQKAWKVLKYFMIIFFAGYMFIFVYVVFLGHSELLQSFEGLIFLFGALFVYFVVRIGFDTIADFRRTTVSKRYVDKIVDSMADTLIVLNVGPDLRITKVNQATLNLLGYKKSEIINLPMKRIFGTDKQLKQFIEKCSTGSWLINQDAKYITKTGSKIPVLLSISCIIDNKNNIEELIIAAQDITQRIVSEKALKASERKYRLLNKELVESNSMKKLLLDVIAHDLKNPVGVIKGFVDFGLENDPENEICKEIQTGTENLLKVIDNATVISRVSAGDEIDKEAIDITAMIKIIAKEFSSAIQFANMKLDINIKNQIIVNANPIISEVFHNYISNAIKYASSGKKIIIEAKVDEDILTVNVIDYGETIPVKDQKNVFKRRVQLGKTSGSGLGLAIVSSIAKSHNAEVGVKSNSPKGNIFYIKFSNQ